MLNAITFHSEDKYIKAGNRGLLLPLLKAVGGTVTLTTLNLALSGHPSAAQYICNHHLTRPRPAASSLPHLLPFRSLPLTNQYE